MSSFHVHIDLAIKIISITKRIPLKYELHLCNSTEKSKPKGESTPSATRSLLGLSASHHNQRRFFLHQPAPPCFVQNRDGDIEITGVGAADAGETVTHHAETRRSWEENHAGNIGTERNLLQRFHCHRHVILPLEITETTAIVRPPLTCL